MITKVPDIIYQACLSVDVWRHITQNFIFGMNDYDLTKQTICYQDVGHFRHKTTKVTQIVYVAFVIG